MIKVKVDISELKNEVSRLHHRAICARDAKTDNERRDEVSALVEMIRTLKMRLENERLG